jgi:Dolichyl-phosphate-mannose-protein mannosyltransferase
VLAIQSPINSQRSSVDRTTMPGPPQVTVTGFLGSRQMLFVGVGLASLVYFLCLVYYAQVRPLDGDEGYYTTAARLAWQGKTPYRDFAYPQGILLPYLYSWIWPVHPRSLAAMRCFSAACGAIAVFLWGIWLVSARRFSAAVALATFAVILFHPYWVWWNVAFKTFAVSNLLISVAMVCLYAALHSQRAKWFLIAGLAMGACASVRSLYAPLVPFVFLWLLLMELREARGRFRGAVGFLGGATLGVLPMMVSFVTDPQAFIFNNVRYRSLLSPHESLRHTIHVYLNNILSLLNHTYFVATILLAIVGGLSLLKLRNQPEGPYNREDYRYFQLAFLMLLVYTVTSLIPFPVFDQYFTSPLLPFLVVFIAEGLRVIFRYQNVSPVLLAVLAPVLFFYGLKREAAEYAPAANQQISSFRKVTAVLEANSRENDVVLSIWPGYVFEAGRPYFPGSENQFNYDIGYKISPEARRRYHLLSKEEVIEGLSTRAMDVYISSTSKYYLEATMSPGELQAFRAALNANYALVGGSDGVEVYRRR